MFTLAFLLIVLAATAYSALAAAHRPLDPVQALPVGVLGLAWRRLGDRRTGSGQKTLWIGDGDETAFRSAYGADRDGLRAVGFSWGGEHMGYYDRPVCWEPVPAPENAVVLDAVARATQASHARAREEEVRRAKAEAERQRRADEEFAREGETRLEAVAELRRRLAAHPWAWTRGQRDRAADVLAQGDRPSASAANVARNLVLTVDTMLARVTERAQTERVEKWWSLAADPEIRVEVHHAAKYLSALDDDFASIENAQGWSKAHTHLGHVISDMPALGHHEAAHALKAVYPHRRQLRSHVRLRLFGEA